MKYCIALIMSVMIFGCGKSLIIEGDWSKLRMTYYILENGKRVARTFDISDKQSLAKIQNGMEILERNDSWSGVGDECYVVDSIGVSWNISFVFENRIDICDRATKRISYIYHMNNSMAYNAARDECLRNELISNPNAVISNIILRTNLHDHCYVPLIKSAQQVDSAEASTIAVPPSEPSGSPR